MDYKEYFSEQYLCLMVNYWEMKLSELPVVGVVNGRGMRYVREYDENFKIIQDHRIHTAKGQDLYKIFEKREYIKLKIKEYKSVWKSKTKRTLPKIDYGIVTLLINDDSTSLNMSFYNTLVAEAAVRDYGIKDHPRNYNGIYMRSKLEEKVAMVLEQLDLTYKYEPLIELDGNYKYTDFFVPVFIVNRCFPIEVAGMLDTISYYNKFQRDVYKYIKSGYLFNYNLLVIVETDDYQANIDQIARNICDFVNNQVQDALIKKKIMFTP